MRFIFKRARGISIEQASQSALSERDRSTIFMVQKPSKKPHKNVSLSRISHKCRSPYRLRYSVVLHAVKTPRIYFWPRTWDRIIIQLPRKSGINIPAFASGTHCSHRRFQRLNIHCEPNIAYTR